MKRDFALRYTLMNAAGILGFAPDARGPVALERLGAFIAGPVSLEPRTPASERRCLEFTGGFLLHTGHPNPGLKAVMRRYAGRWASSPLPVVVHLLGQRVDDVARMARRLEGLEGVMALEVGLPPDVDPASARLMVEAAAGELPLIARLPLDRALELAGAAAIPGLAAFSLGAPRGALPDQSGKTVSGRLYGPALFPLALAAVHTLARGRIPVIGAGGVYSQAQADAMLSAGAVGVQLDSVLWRGVWE